jgi:hypothetical protein
LSAVNAGEKVIEIAVAAIEPVELHAAPQQQAGGRQQGAVGFFDEQALPGGCAGLAGDFKCGLDQGRRHGFPFDAACRTSRRGPGEGV